MRMTNTITIQYIDQFLLNYNIYSCSTMNSSQDLQHRFPEATTTQKLNNHELMVAYGDYVKTAAREEFDVEIEQLKFKHQQQLFQLECKNLELLHQLQSMKEEAQNWEQYSKIIQMDKDYLDKNTTGLKAENAQLYPFVESLKVQKQQIVEMYDTEIKQLRVNIDDIENKGEKQREAYVKKIGQMKETMEKEKAELQDNFNQAWKKLQDTQSRLKEKQAECKTTMQDYYGFKLFVVETLKDLHTEQFTSEVDLLRKTATLVEMLKQERNKTSQYLKFKEGNNNFVDAKIMDRINSLLTIKEEACAKYLKIQEDFQITLNQRLASVVQNYEKSYGMELIEQIQSKFIDLSCTIDDLQKNKNKTSQQMEILQRQAKQITTQKSSNEQKLKDAALTISQLTKLKDTKQKQIAEQMHKFDALVIDNSKKLKEQEDNKMKIINEMQKKINELREQNQKTGNKVSEMAKQLENSSATRQQIQKIKVEMSGKDNAILSLQEQIKIKDDQISQYEQVVKKMRQKYDRKKKQIQTMELEIQTLKNQKTQMQLTSMEANQKLVSYERQINELKLMIQAKENQLDVKTKKMEDIEYRLFSLAKSQCKYVGKNYQEAMQELQMFIENLVKKGSSSDGFLEMDSISRKFQDNMPWVRNIISSCSGYQNLKSKFIIKITELGKDFTKFIDNPNTVIVCVNSKKAIFCIYIKKLGKALTDSDPVAVFSGKKPIISPKTMAKSKGFRTSFVNPKDFVLGRVQIVISKLMSQMVYRPNKDGYFTDLDSQQMFGIKPDETANLEQIQIYEIVQEN